MFANDSAGENCGLLNSEIAGLNARDNYWGSPTGPGPAPANYVCNTNSASTITAPYAVKPSAVLILKP